MLVRDGEIAEIGAPGHARGARRRRGRSTARAATCSRASSTRTCTCARRARSTRRTSTPAPAPPPPAATSPSSRCRTPTRSVDSAPVLRSLREAARREARIPVGFMASITRGLDGEALTEMAELADAGALGFTDDGKPVHRAGILRKALQYQRLAGRVLCLHEEDPTLSGRGVMHEGEVSARLGLAGIPSISRVDADRPRRLAGRLRGRADPHPAPERARVGRGDRRGQGARRADHRRGQPAPPHAHARGAAGAARHAAEDEPAAARRGRPPGADRRPAATARSTASPPTTRRTRARRRRCPSRRRRWARPGWRPPSRRSTPSSCCPASCRWRSSSTSSPPAPRCVDLPLPAIRTGEGANFCLLDLEARV